MRKTFLLGGSPFTAPEFIGAGILARASQISPDIADEKKVKNEGIATRYTYEYSLRLFELLLTPELPSVVTVKEAYDLATNEEVTAISNFFLTNASGKTKSAPSKANDSSAFKKIAKART